MARKPTISRESLEALGVRKLAELVAAEAAQSAPFRKLVNAALAAAKGPGAIASIVDKRLAALSRARAFIDWDRTREFAADLRAALGVITGELAHASPPMAAERLVAFLASCSSVYRRVDDSSGVIQRVYEDAMASLPALVAAMPEQSRGVLPRLILDRLEGEAIQYLPEMAESLAPLLSPDVLQHWDGLLADASPSMAKDSGERDWEALARQHAVRQARQHIAIARQDIDAVIALEETREPRLRDHAAIAELLLSAGRAAEALRWIRQRDEDERDVAYLSRDMVSDHAGPVYPSYWTGALLEARILDRLGNAREAEELRWDAFSRTLAPVFLQEQLKQAEDFAEFGILDRAFAMVDASPGIHAALAFYTEWPDLNRAAAVVVRHRGKWDGRNYALLALAAERLEDDHALAAVILYRALLDVILSDAKAKAYGHGAYYLHRLDHLASAPSGEATPDVEPHQAYRERLARTHGRKYAFWTETQKYTASR
jgi:hypothetical protein